MKQYKYRVNGQTYDVVINEINGKNAKVEVNGVSFDVEMEGEGGEGIPSISGISVASDSAASAAPAPAPAAAAPAPKAAQPAASQTPGRALRSKLRFPE